VSEFYIAIEGTPRAPLGATMLALPAAVSHAVFGALQKGSHDPWLARGAIDICYRVMALPAALFLVSWPPGAQWLLRLGAIPWPRRGRWCRRCRPTGCARRGATCPMAARTRERPALPRRMWGGNGR
jgi:hypothetical protein